MSAPDPTLAVFLPGAPDCSYSTLGVYPILTHPPVPDYRTTTTNSPYTDKRSRVTTVAPPRRGIVVRQRAPLIVSGQSVLDHRTDHELRDDGVKHPHDTHTYKSDTDVFKVHMRPRRLLHGAIQCCRGVPVFGHRSQQYERSERPRRWI